MASTSLEAKGPEIDKAAEFLVAKIGNKFQALIFLAGLSSAIFGIQLNIMLTSNDAPPPLMPASMLLMLGATMIFIYGSRRLDALTMPKMFWGKTPDLSKKPRSAKFTDLEVLELELADLIALWERMKLHWTFLNGGASVFACASLALMLLPVLTDWKPTDSIVLSSNIFCLVMPISYLVLFWCRCDREKLSTD